MASPGSRYLPSTPVVAAREAPVASSTAVILASGTAAPEASSTTPWKADCPNTVSEKENRAKKKHSPYSISTLWLTLSLAKPSAIYTGCCLPICGESDADTEIGVD
jgi:hypothetical protein